MNDVKVNPATQLFLIFCCIYNGNAIKKVAFLPNNDRLQPDLLEDRATRLLIFIRVLQDRAGSFFFVEDGIPLTLQAIFALKAKALIALFDRALRFCCLYFNVNVRTKSAPQISEEGAAFEVTYGLSTVS